jgi:predicted flavoprotein YhiN
MYCDLSGISAEVVAACAGHRFQEKMLITHRGFSGPAILQISSYWRKGLAVSLDLAPGVDVAEGGGPRGYLPKRLADRVAEIAGAAWADRIHEWSVLPVGTEGFDKAEVTGGGVDTDELSSKTFEARKVPGLHFVGEALDVTGHLGGFNFQWAWSSGFCAGQFC